MCECSHHPHTTNHNQSNRGISMATPILIKNNDEIYDKCIEDLMKAEALIDFALQNSISEASLAYYSQLFMGDQ